MTWRLFCTNTNTDVLCNICLYCTALLHTYMLHINNILSFLLLRRVIVMDRGHVSEMDSPANLISQRGQFYRMCREAGLV